MRYDFHSSFSFFYIPISMYLVPLGVKNIAEISSKRVIFDD